MNSPNSFFTSPDQPGETMVYTVDLGNGHVADIEGPKGATPEQLQAAMAEHQSNTSGGQQTMQGGFADQLPQQAETKMAPEDVAVLEHMARTGATAGQLRAFAHGKGFAFPNADDAVAFAKTHPGARLDHIDLMPQAAKPDVPEAFSGEQALRDHMKSGGTFGFGDEIHGAANGVGALLHDDSYRCGDQLR